MLLKKRQEYICLEHCTNMGYIRTKYIAGNPYAYFVECKGKKQKVKAYLGRVFEGSISKRSSVNGKSKRKFLINFVAQISGPSSVVVDGLTVTKGCKNVVLKIDDGYVCSFTLNRILRFRKSDDLEKDGKILAKYFLDAGLPVTQDEFIAYYQKC